MESVSKLVRCFEEGCLSTADIEEINKDHILKASKELQCYIAGLDDDLLQLQEFLSSLQYLVKHNSSCYTHLFDQGILRLMKVVFHQVLGRVLQDGPSESLQYIIELCTETSNKCSKKSISDRSVAVIAKISAKACVVLELGPHFLDLLQAQLLGFQTRLEVLKSTNTLLELCPTTVKDVLLNREDNEEKIFGLVNLVKTVGDYEFQVGILECLMRVFPRKSRHHYASKFFTDQDMLDGFMAIKDKDFEVDCRRFLNSVNALSEDPNKGVFSLPCVRALVGSKQLRKPSDAGYEEFWVDFNIGSERLTLFCEQDSLYSQDSQMDGELWETVAIYKTDVLQCACHELDSLIELEICLKSPVCDIYPSQHQDVTDNKIKVYFSPQLEDHIAHAVGCTFNFSEKRSKVSTVQTPLQISMKDVQDTDVQAKMNYPAVPSPAQTCSQESVSRRRKVSVPSIPMQIPIASPAVSSSNFDKEKAMNDAIPETQNMEPVVQRTEIHSKVSTSINCVLKTKQDNKIPSEENIKDFAVPKTPVKKTRSKTKVKTPVVTVTPPSRKTRKQDEKCNSVADNKENVSSLTISDEYEQRETVIPDSLPFTENSPCKIDTAETVKASVSNERCLDDSGIGVDESRSTIARDTSRDTSRDIKTDKEDSECRSFIEDKCVARKPSNKVKGKARKNAESKQTGNRSTLENKQNVHDVEHTEDCRRVLTPLKETSEDETTTLEGMKDVKNNTTTVKNASFGFDSLCMGEVVDSIPDSLENLVSSDKPLSQDDSSETKTSSKCKKQKKYRNSKITDKKDMETYNKNNSVGDVTDDMGSKNKENSIKSDVKRNEIQRKKRFTDTGKSLQELHDLDNKEDRIEVVEAETEGKDRRSPSRKVGKNENLNDMYTFSDPDPDLGKSVVNKSKGVNLSKKNKNSTISNKFDVGSNNESGKGKNEKSDRHKHGKDANDRDETLNLNDEREKIGRHDRPKQGKGNISQDETVNVNDDGKRKKEKAERPKQGKDINSWDETVNLNEDEKETIEKPDRPKQGKDMNNQGETVNLNCDERGKIEKSDRPKQSKKNANIQNKVVKQTVGKGKQGGKIEKPSQGKNVFNEDEAVNENWGGNKKIEKTNKKDTNKHVEATEQKSSEKEKIGKTSRSKKGKTIACKDLDEVNEIKTDNATESGRKLRSRGNQSYKEFEDSEPEEFALPYSSNDSKESSGQSQSSFSDLTPTEKSPVKQTPDNSPSKCVVNEQKIKSSLKKSMNSSDSVKEKDTNKRKSKVSFDLPNSESQENDPISMQGKENETTESVGGITELIENDELNTKSSDTSDDLFKDETTEIEKSIDSETEGVADSNKVTAERTLKNKRSTRNKKPTKEAESKGDEKNAASEIIPPTSSPVSSSESSDSLYVESDDSYNARRYKMENGNWNTSKRKRRSSLKTKSKDIISKSKKNTSYNEKHCDSLQTVSKEVENISDKDKAKDITSGKDREKSKKTAKKLKGHRKGSANSVASDTETAGIVVMECNQKKTSRNKVSDEIFRKSKLNRSKVKNEHDASFESFYQNRKLKGNDKLSKYRDESIEMEEDSYASDKEVFRQEPINVDKKLNGNLEENEKQFDDLLDGSQLAVEPFNDEENFQENTKDKKRRSSDKKKGKNLTYTMNSFEKMECDDNYAVSQHSIQTISSTKGKSMVFQMSYLKSQTNSLNKNKSNSKKPYVKEPAYDPYDFDAQCENASMASERIGRKDVSKELNNKYRKSSEKKYVKSKDHKVKSEKGESSLTDYQESFSQDLDNENVTKTRNHSSEKLYHKSGEGSENEHSHKNSKKHKDRTSKTEIRSRDKSMQGNCFMLNSSPEIVIDLEDECYKDKEPKKINLVQDKKTKLWYRTDTGDCEETVINSRKEKKRSKTEKEKKAEGFPSVDSFNKSMVNQVSCIEDDMVIVDSSMEENSISQFSKILKEITAGRGKFDQNFNISINGDFEDDNAEIKTPCIIGSISSTPKVGSGKRKHYKPLNISVIKTPQSCKISDSDSDGDSQTGKRKQSKRKTRKKKAVKYKEASESESEADRNECKSRMSTESICLLDSSQNISNRSEKSWILERKKTPKLKKSSKTYKVKKKMKSRSEQNCGDSTESEESSTDEQMEQENDNKSEKVTEYLLEVGTPLTIPSLSFNTPAVTPSIKSLRSYEDLDDYILTPPSPKKHYRKRKEYEDDIEVEQTQENCTISLNMSCQNSDGDDSFEDIASQTGLHVGTLQRQVQSEECSDEEERSVHKLLQENMKLLLGDSGFASGPSSEVRPTRSTLKRKFPDIEEISNIVSSSSSQIESDDEMEKSIFVPKKLFKFDPAVHTPQAPSLYSDVTEEHEVDFGFQSGLSTVMAAFGADIQNHLKSKKQKIERFTKDTLKETQQHFHQTVVEQQQYLSNLKDDFGAKMLLELAALEKDIQRLNEAEKKMEDFFKCQLEVLRSNEESQEKRLNNLKKLQSCFLDKSKKVTKYNLNVHKNMQEQLKKDMAALQRKLIAETQRQEYMDVKMKLQKLF